MTPHELVVMVQQRTKRKNDDLRTEVVMSYLNSSNAHFKQPLTYEKYLSVFGLKEEKKQEQMTDDQMYSVVKQLNMIFGGTES